MKKTFFYLLASILIAGCGGGSQAPADPNAPVAQTQNYCLLVPLHDNPKSYICDDSQRFIDQRIGECTSEVSAPKGYYTVNNYKDLNACKAEGERWIAQYNKPEDKVISAGASEALVWLRSMRKKLGLKRLRYDSRLEKAATSHAHYLCDVMANYGVDMGHDEDNASYPSDYYTGETSSKRIAHAGYYGSAGEVLSFLKPTPLLSIKSLIISIYHRQELIQKRYQDMFQTKSALRIICLSNFKSPE